MRKLASIALACALVLVASAHVGSPDVLFDGNAGPYPVRVIVRPPSVVPGLAEVVVRVNAPDVDRVSIRPVFWRTGAKGAPSGDDAKRVEGQQQVYTGQLWLMAYGAYSVYVTVVGARGSGQVIVPVSSLATGRLALSPALGALLIVLGIVLVAGFLTIIYAASGESLVLPGEVFDAPRRKRAAMVTAIAAPVLAVLLFGGAKWWNAEDAAYRRHMFGRPAADPSIANEPGHRQLTLTVHDTAAFRSLYAPVAPDHGKMMHLFLISAGEKHVFAHLHPVEAESLVFKGEIPWIPAGRYLLFGDMTLDNGLSLTVTNTLDIPAAIGSITPSDSDDSWVDAPAATPLARGAAAPLGDGYSMAWTGTDRPISAGESTDLSFAVRDAKGATVQLEPYLGMAAHAVILRDDDSVFIHLHPMGTVTAVAQEVFALRDRGDTTLDGHVTPRALHVPAMRALRAMRMSGDITVPYEFPKAGRYRVWVQVKAGGKVRTGVFDVAVR